MNREHSEDIFSRSGDRSIRNINVSPRRAARIDPDQGRRAHPSFEQRKEPRSRSRVWIWVAAGLSVLVLAVIAIFAFRSTAVTVTPVSHAVAFNTPVTLSASPTGSSSGLSYSVSTLEFEDSAVVPSNGSEHVSDRASGTVTVYNEYSTASVRLIKNTRFATPDGLVFRVPATVVVPGKKGATPGSVAVTVFADAPGDKYNIGPVARFTVPGLKSTPDMYTHVYARSAAAMAGGFEGDRPAIAQSDLDSARAQVRTRLEAKIRDSARSLASSTATVFPSLMQITYASLPQTAEAGGGARIHEKATALVPVFPGPVFAQAVADAASVETGGASVSLTGLDGLAVNQPASTSSTVLGTSPLALTVSGSAELVWDVDAAALQKALAGRDQSAFQGVISGFPSIQEARARIEPFWKGSFPQDPSAIRIDVTSISAGQ